METSEPHLMGRLLLSAALGGYAHDIGLMSIPLAGPWVCLGACIGNVGPYSPAIIADGVHVDLRAVRTAHRLLKDRLYLVSDCTFIDYPVDHFEFEGVTVYNRDGKFVNEEGNLAGSAITVWHAVKNCVEHGVCTLEEALRKVTSIPAEIAGMQQDIGVIAEGARANLLVLDKELQPRQR